MKNFQRMVFSCLTILFAVAVTIYAGYIIFSYAKFVFGLPWWLGLLLIAVFGMMVWSYKMEKDKRDKE